MSSATNPYNLDQVMNVIRTVYGSEYNTGDLINNILNPSNCLQSRYDIVENNEELLGLAQQKFEQKGLNNVKTVLGDAYRGWMPNGPYDVIVITGALP